jgi:hypothetical protein
MAITGYISRSGHMTHMQQTMNVAKYKQLVVRANLQNDKSSFLCDFQYAFDCDRHFRQTFHHCSHLSHTPAAFLIGLCPIFTTV